MRVIIGLEGFGALGALGFWGLGPFGYNFPGNVTSYALKTLFMYEFLSRV